MATLKFRIASRCAASVCIIAFLCVGTVAAAAFKPKNIRCGTVKNYELKNTVAWKDQWEEDSYGPKPKLKDGEIFAIVTVLLDKAKSIGKYDFHVNEESCLGMAVEDGEFDPADWEHKFKDEVTRIRLVYKVVENERPHRMTFAYEMPYHMEPCILLKKEKQDVPKDDIDENIDEFDNDDELKDDVEPVPSKQEGRPKTEPKVKVDKPVDKIKEDEPEDVPAEPEDGEAIDDW